jgi:hypothetical protein
MYVLMESLVIVSTMRYMMVHTLVMTYNKYNNNLSPNITHYHTINSTATSQGGKGG